MSNEELKNASINAAYPFCLNYIFEHGLEIQFKEYCEHTVRITSSHWDSEDEFREYLKQFMSYNNNFERLVYKFVTQSLDTELRAIVMDSDELRSHHYRFFQL